MAHLDISTRIAEITVIDLIICDPTVCIDFTWKVHDDTFGNDHFPIKNTEPSNEKNTSLEVRQGQLRKIQGKM